MSKRISEIMIPIRILYVACVFPALSRGFPLGSMGLALESCSCLQEFAEAGSAVGAHGWPTGTVSCSDKNVSRLWDSLVPGWLQTFIPQSEHTMGWFLL